MSEKHVYVVFTLPEEDRDDEYNDWYTNQHLSEILEVEGIVAAQRFELSPTDPPQNGQYPYLAIYEIEGDLDAARAALDAARAEGRIHVSPALDQSASKTGFYTAITDRRTSPGASDQG